MYSPLGIYLFVLQVLSSSLGIKKLCRVNWLFRLVELQSKALLTTFYNGTDSINNIFVCMFYTYIAAVQNLLYFSIEVFSFL